MREPSDRHARVASNTHGQLLACLVETEARILQADQLTNDQLRVVVALAKSGGDFTEAKNRLSEYAATLMELLQDRDRLREELKSKSV